MVLVEQAEMEPQQEEAEEEEEGEGRGDDPCTTYTLEMVPPAPGHFFPDGNTHSCREESKTKPKKTSE